MTNQTIEKDCPDQGVLVNFLQGKLVPPELENCESHLEGCDACQETLSGINASDTLSEVVAKAMDPHAPPTDDEQIVQNLVRRLGNPADFTITRSDISSKELLRDRAAEVLLHVSPDPEDDESLGLLAGFRLRELLGSGGTGVVFRAYDLALDREIALKVLRPSLGDLARDRFVAEARAAASIDHENVVAIYQVGEQERMAWIAMKWVPGETLESRLLQEGSLTEDEVRKLSIQIARGLAEAHRQQLVHRDIKPANVWIGDADGKVLILDFGLVRITDNDPALTATGMLAGTPNFMSPEQAKGQELDARSDLFSLGCVMYQMITGTLPFGSPTILATLQSIQTQQPEPPIIFAEDCSEDLSDLTMALLEKQPANRVDSAESLVRCFETPRSEWPANIKRCIAARRDLNESVQQPAATQSGRFGAGTFIAAMLLGLFGFVLWRFAPQVIRIATNQGELVIETDDENVEVTVSQGGGTVRVLDTDSGASFDIRSGEFQISAVGKDGKTEFEVVPDKLTMQRGGREVVTVTRIKKPASPSPISLADGSPNKSTNNQQTNSETVGQAKLLYRGKQLSEWLNVLEIDRNPQSQSEALKACAALYASSGQNDELIAVLKSYLKRNTANVQLYQGSDQVDCFSGFSDSLRTLPPRKIVEFFKTQLKLKDETTIDWTYRGMTSPRSQDSGKHASRRSFSTQLKTTLGSNAAEALSLISDLEDDKTVLELYRYLIGNLDKGPVSDEGVNTIQALMFRLFKQDPEEMIQSAYFVPNRVLAPELFASVKSRLLAADTSSRERDKLVRQLIRIQESAEGHASFILEILAEIIANQLQNPSKAKFIYYQEMIVLEPSEPLKQGKEYRRTADSRTADGTYQPIKIRGAAVVARNLLSVICERLLDEETASPDEVAKSVLKILAKPASSKQSAELTELEHYSELRINEDINALIKFSKKQPGEFSVFVSGERKFGGDFDSAPSAKPKKTTAQNSSSRGGADQSGDQKANSKSQRPTNSTLRRQKAGRMA